MKVHAIAAAVVWLAAAPAWAQGGGMLDRLMALDLNHDGAITHAEAEQVRAALFDRIDANGDGYLSEAEQATLQRENGGGRGGQRQGEADVNHDGRISRAEMMAQPYRVFDRLDFNNDNVVSADELAQVRRFSGG